MLVNAGRTCLAESRVRDSAMTFPHATLCRDEVEAVDVDCFILITDLGGELVIFERLTASTSLGKVTLSAATARIVSASASQKCGQPAVSGTAEMHVLPCFSYAEDRGQLIASGQRAETYKRTLFCSM